MDTPDKIQFHPGFYGAAELEFRLETAEIEFNIEYNLSKEPLRVDLLVVGKQNDMQIENEAGRIFKRYNIIEYKSPDDGLTIDDFFKTIGYACLYKAFGKTVNQIPEEQVTVSLFRDTYPQELFRTLKKSGRKIEEKYPGIYYISGNVQFDVQIVVMNQLSPERHSAFRVLSKNAKEEDVRRFLKESLTLVSQGDRENADAVFEVSIAANSALYEKIRSDEVMCKAMENLMKDVISQKEEEARQEGRQEGRQEERRNIAVSMIQLGRSTMEEISAITGLTLEALLSIESSMKAAD
ncbi:MAG: hypothetical protein K2L86_10775 [Lachnospiraceae bacterium]|nr:hypothetical protein [Lachnospiraceae bacterium]